MAISIKLELNQREQHFFWDRAESCLYLNDTKKNKKSLFQPYCAMPSLNIKFEMHLTVKLSEKKSYIIRARANLITYRKIFLQLFFLSGLLNSLSNNIIQIKSFFYNVLLTQLSFPRNIGKPTNLQSHFRFVQHNLICELLPSNYIFLLLECIKTFITLL